MLWLPLISIGTGAAFSLAQRHVERTPCPRAARRHRARARRGCRAPGRTGVPIRRAQRPCSREIWLSRRRFTETRALGGRIAETLPSDRSVFEVGAHGLYFYAGRLAPMPFVDSLYGIDSAYPKLYRERMLPALLQAPPDVLVIRRGILRSGTDIAQRDFVATLLDSAPYVEDKSLSGEYLLVLRRLRKDSQ
jgi:hypothetical protein